MTVGKLDVNTVFEDKTNPDEKEKSGLSDLTLIKRHFLFDIMDAIGFIGPIERDNINH